MWGKDLGAGPFVCRMSLRSINSISLMHVQVLEASRHLCLSWLSSLLFPSPLLLLFKPCLP